MRHRLAFALLTLVGCADAPQPASPLASSEAAEDVGPARGRNDRQDALYRSRVRAFLKQGFSVQGTGLPADELMALRGESSCALDANGVVVSCTSTKPSGNAKFDAAVVAALDAKKGLQTPPPPADKPGWRTDQITFSLRCSASCN